MFPITVARKTIVTTEDVMDRVATKVYPPINPGETNTVESYSYTASGQLAQVASVTNGVTNRVAYFTYDGLNRLTNKDCAEGVLAYTWTPDGHLRSIAAYRRGLVATNGPITNGTPVDASLSYGYDALGRLSSVTNGTLSNVATYSYDNVGDVAGCAYPNGVSHVYGYNAQNRLTSLAVSNATTVFGLYSYTLGLTGARLGSRELAGSGTLALRWGTGWEYDGRYGANSPAARLYRLTRETLANASGWAGAITNIYDPNGNRLTWSVGLAITPAESLTNQSLRYDLRDLVDSDSSPNDANTNYDAVGNTLVDNGASTGDLYDAQNRLIARGASIKLGYDHEGNRVNKTVSGVTTYYLVD